MTPVVQPLIIRSSIHLDHDFIPETGLIHLHDHFELILSVRPTIMTATAFSLFLD